MRSPLLRSIAILCVSVSACASPFEGNSAHSEPDQSGLRALILESNAAPTPGAAPLTESGRTEEIKTENGVAQDCVYKRFTGTALYETLVSFDPNADSIWPGAIIQTRSLSNGLASPIGLPRRPGSITVTDASVGGTSPQKFSRALNSPSQADVRRAVDGILAEPNVKLAAKTNYLAEAAYSMSEASLKIGISAEWMSGSVRANFQGDWLAKKTTMVVRFVQAYYTVAFAAPESPEKVFGRDVTRADAEPYMGPGNAPAYVSSVTYGRMMLMRIESNESEADIRAALDASFDAGATKIGVEASASQKKVLANSSISVFVLGGSPDDAARIQTGDAESRASALSDYIQRGANFDRGSPGVPISYTVRLLANNETLKVASTLDYRVPVCTPASTKLDLVLDRLRFGGDGKAGGSTETSYEIWFEVPRVQGQALPPTQGTTDDRERTVAAQGKQGLDDGAVITLGPTQRFISVTKEQEAVLGIGARVTGNGKACEMSRSHVFRFDPTTGAGVWTNTGKNSIRCGVEDTAWLGNNGLDVTLDYDLAPSQTK